MALKYLSPTSINTYLRCPRKFYLRYVKGLRSKPSIHLVLGKAVHEALAKYADHNKTIGSNQNDIVTALLYFYEQAWDKQAGCIEQLDIPQTEVKGFFRDGELMLTKWVEQKRHLAIMNDSKAKAELKIFSKQHRVMGIIDAIHGPESQATVVDYKTGAKDEITQDIKVQMAVYALLHKEKFGCVPDMVAVDFLKTGAFKSFKVNNNFLALAESLCVEIHQKIKSTDEQDYPCTCGGYCQWDFLDPKNGTD